MPWRDYIANDMVLHNDGSVSMFLGIDVQASSAQTRALLGWEPTHPGLIADLDAGHYFTAARPAAGR